MIKKTMDYVSPKTEVLVVQTEGTILDGSDTASKVLAWEDWQLGTPSRNSYGSAIDL